MVMIYQCLDGVADWLEVNGYKLDSDLRRRDPNEPGRDIKEQWEDKLYRLMRRYFRGQRDRLAQHFSGRLAIRTFKSEVSDVMSSIPDSVWRDPDIDNLLLQMIISASEDGVDLFRQSVNIGIDYSQVNTQAARWARRYMTKWLNELDDVTRTAVREAVATFIERPGMTIGDAVSMLPFDENRALRVAVTEITRVFAQANQLAGSLLQKQFPDVRVEKQWFTNADDRVCGLCGPLNNVSVPIDEDFPNGGGIGPPRHVNCRCWNANRTVIADG